MKPLNASSGTIKATEVQTETLARVGAPVAVCASCHRSCIVVDIGDDELVEPQPDDK
jgi:hypothetical protein